MADVNQIVPYYAQPHVHTVINDYTQYDETVATPSETQDLPFSTVVVAGADQGIDNTFIKLSDLNTKIAIFGKGNFQKYGQPSLQADALFNGSTNVWFCRVLPDNASYANMIVLAHFRRGKILDDQNQETGMYRMEIKFTTTYAGKPALTDGPLDDAAILEYANMQTKLTPDDVTGYYTIPLFYVRSIGRGKYGNAYSMSISRDTDSEKEYEVKMYRFALVNNTSTTRVTNVYSGSLYQTVRYEMSTLISDVLDQYDTGTCPVYVHSFEDNFEYLYNFYQDIVELNDTYLGSAGGSTEELLELRTAKEITEETFDPIFGYLLNTRTSEHMPYYRNYTSPQTNTYVAPDLVISGSQVRPANKSEWPTVGIGMTCLMINDPLNNGARWQYTVLSVDQETGNITYNEGVEVEIDADQYTGENLSQSAGIRFRGGFDGDFEEIHSGDISRAPTAAEMKLLLSREYVKAFRGEKDRKILSPARVDLDFIFDANYNMTAEGTLTVDSGSLPLYHNSSVLTDADYATLTAVSNVNGATLYYDDLNVKRAMYDLNEFRNRNGMTVSTDMGAGCLLHLDCGVVGSKNLSVNYELMDIIDMMSEFTGKSTSIDLGYYDIFDPYTRRRISVTASYFLAKNLIPHLLTNGLNKPFVYSFAQLNAIQRNTALTVSGDMIRDSFRPDIDLIDWDVKEQLYTNRINYYITSEEGRVVQRACQNTRQLDASALLEENNVRVLNSLKKSLERSCRSYLYNWNEPEVRKGYTDTQMENFRPWIGTLVQDLEIKFTANEFEEQRMIMHCYVVVKFRNIIKRIIVEINIQRPDYSGGDE